MANIATRCLSSFVEAESSRKLVTIRKIGDLLPIVKADNLELAVVDGWRVVVRKGDVAVGDKCVFFEIDSFLPEGNDLWKHLVDKKSIVFNGKRGHRVKSVRLMGALSQGFVLPLRQLPELENLPRDIDVATFLGVTKFEEEEVEGAGPFPSFIPKTFQERCQNIVDRIFPDALNTPYEITMKVDGCSLTSFFDGPNQPIGIASRNLRVNQGPYVAAVKEIGLDQAITRFYEKTSRSIAVQAELMGPGRNGNREQFKEVHLVVFDVFDIDAQKYLPPAATRALVQELCTLGAPRLEHAPVLYEAATLAELGVNSLEQLLAFAEGPSMKHTVREGIVFKIAHGEGGDRRSQLGVPQSFKVLSNAFLLKQK